MEISVDLCPECGAECNLEVCDNCGEPTIVRNPLIPADFEISDRGFMRFALVVSGIIFLIALLFFWR